MAKPKYFSLFFLLDLIKIARGFLDFLKWGGGIFKPSPTQIKGGVYLLYCLLEYPLLEREVGVAPRSEEQRCVDLLNGKREHENQSYGNKFGYNDRIRIQSGHSANSE